MVSLVKATSYVVQEKRSSLHGMQTLVGMYTWAMLLQRPALAIFDEVYKVTGEPEAVMDLSIEVRIELMMAAALLPLMVADLRAPWIEDLYMTDASPSGGGVIKATATREEIVKEASIATKSGWTAKREEIDLATGLLMETEATDIPTMITLNVYRFLHLCSGSKHDEDLCHAFRAEWASEGVMVIIDMVTWRRSLS